MLLPHDEVMRYFDDVISTESKCIVVITVWFLRVKIWFFDVHLVMKPVGGAKITWSAKRFL